MKNLRQLGYVCELNQFESTLAHWERALGAGPFYIDEAHPENQRYYGQPTDAEARIALTFIGRTQVEIIAPLNEAASPWTEWRTRLGKPPVGGHFHHLLIETDDFDMRRDALLESGAQEGFEADLRGRRMAYVDTLQTMGYYVELVEWRDWNGITQQIMQDECADWDGTDPRRDYHALMAFARRKASESMD